MLSTEYRIRRKEFLCSGPFKLWLVDDSHCNEQFPLEINENDLVKEKKRKYQEIKN